MKIMTKNTITSIIGFLFMISGIIAAFVVQSNTILLVITLTALGIGLTFYKSELYEILKEKLK